MFTREERESFDQPTDHAGCTVAAGAMALLCPVAPGEADNFSLRLTPSMRHCAALLGERLDLRWTVKPTAARLELVRKPSESKAELSGAQLTPDVRGVYIVRAWLGPWQRDI